MLDVENLMQFSESRGIDHHKESAQVYTGLLDTISSENRKAQDFLQAKECEEDDVKASEAIVKLLEKQDNFKNQLVAESEQLEKD